MTMSSSKYLQFPIFQVTSLLTLTPLLFLVLLLPPLVYTSCEFPESTAMQKDDPPWYSHVMADGSRHLEYYIRRTVMEIHYPNSDRSHVRWSCVMEHQGKLLLKRQDYFSNSYYKCVRFYLRSKSVIQIAWSHESKTFDITLCADSLLMLDPWPLVKYEDLENDYTQCPFSGGFNIKISDSEDGESGCNLMHRPMRMEAECVGGDGVFFDFISDICLPDVNMFVQQKTLSVAGWKDTKNYYVILRRQEDVNLWCLVMPINRNERKNAYLYSDLTCKPSKHSKGFSPKDMRPDLKYLTLELEQRVFSSLCEDEYSECGSVKCNNYVQQECMRSCNACNHTRDLSDCSFPRKFKGSWFLKESQGHRHIQISKSEISIEDVGKFRCVNFPDSYPKKSRTFSTVSLYNNGCRPRYTCIKVNRLAPSVLQYSLSQSYAWPSLKNNFAKSMCDPDRFEADASPIDDIYRSHTESGKPIVAQKSSAATVDCDLSSVYTLSATLPQGYVCSGTMFQHCEDSTKIRMDFSSCGGLIPMTSDYRCLATFEGHYWEKIILVQDVNNGVDVRCFVFSQFYPNDAFVMVASECDKKSFNFARSKIRRPILSIKFRKEDTACVSVPPTPQPTVAPVLATTTHGASSRYSSNSVASSHTLMSHSNRTHADQGHHNSHISPKKTISPYSTGEMSKGNNDANGYREVKGDGSSSRSKTSFDSDSNYNSAAEIVLSHGNYVFVMTLLTLYLTNTTR